MLRKSTVLRVLVGTFLASLSLVSAAAIESYTSRIGSLEFHNSFRNGYPTKDTVAKLFNSYDFNNAVSAYIWAIPQVGFWGVQRAMEQEFEARDGDIVYLEGVDNVRPFLTSNNNTPYIMGTANLAKTGPMVLDVPPGLLLGLVDDAWQRPVTDLGVTGIGQGRGEKVLVVGPGQSVDDEGYHIVRAKTNHIWIIYRILERDAVKAEQLLNTIHHYPYRQRLNPESQRIIVVKNAPFSQAQPRGLAYWQSLHNILSREVVDERDRLFWGMLQPLGLEKGKPFAPDRRQREILEEATFVGESMLKAITFAKRFPTAVWREGSQWKRLLNTSPDQRTTFYDMLEGRAAFFYEATSMSPTYTARFVGKGTKYVFSYRDGDEHWLDGSENYVLRVPRDVPVSIFWDVSVYEVNSRTLIDNPQKIVNRGSLTETLQRNVDGSVDIYFGPEPPEGQENNWIPTNTGENWFAAFRFYGPLEPYYDGSFTLPDIEML